MRVLRLVGVSFTRRYVSLTTPQMRLMGSGFVAVAFVSKAFDPAFDVDGKTRDQVREVAWRKLCNTMKGDEKQNTTSEKIRAVLVRDSPLLDEPTRSIMIDNYMSIYASLAPRPSTSPPFGNDKMQRDHPVYRDYYGPQFCKDWMETGIFAMASYRRKIRQEHASLHQELKRTEGLANSLFYTMDATMMSPLDVAIMRYMTNDMKREAVAMHKDAIKKICQDAAFAEREYASNDRVIAAETARYK
jgi:hypothetical protein